MSGMAQAVCGRGYDTPNTFIQGVGRHEHKVVFDDSILLP